MSKIDLLAYKIEAYDTDGFLNSLSNIKYIVVKFNPVFGFSLISNLEIDQKVNGKFLATNPNIIRNKILYKILFFPLFILDLAKQLIIIYKLYLKFKPRNIYIDNTHVAIIFILIRAFNKKVNLIYASQDWLGDGLNESKFCSPLKYYFSKLFVICDKNAVLRSNIVLNHTLYLQEARIKYWNKKLIQNEVIYKPNFHIPEFEVNIDNNRKSILFLGNCNESSSIENIIKAIKYTEYKLIIIGNINSYLKKMEYKYKEIEITGRVERSEFKKYINRCFVGINLINRDNSHSKYAIQSKVIDYLKFGLPVLASGNLGITTSFINNYNFGLTIDDLNDLSIINSLDEIFKNNYYRDNINKFSKIADYDKITDYMKWDE